MIWGWNRLNSNWTTTFTTRSWLSTWWRRTKDLVWTGITPSISLVLMGRRACSIRTESLHKCHQTILKLSQISTKQREDWGIKTITRLSLRAGHRKSTIYRALLRLNKALLSPCPQSTPQDKTQQMTLLKFLSKGTARKWKIIIRLACKMTTSWEQLTTQEPLSMLLQVIHQRSI